MPKVSRYLYIAVLIVAGEMVFGLPFHTARFFRPTMLEVFGFTNTQLGDLFALYGVTAMLSYFPGGAIADHFSARGLLSASLVATAIGGLFMATIPGAGGMAVLYAFWGFTTIFLFWGALIRATREWGGDAEQGVAFGLLEGGRGVVAAVVAGRRRLHADRRAGAPGPTRWPADRWASALGSRTGATARQSPPPAARCRSPAPSRSALVGPQPASTWRRT